MISPQSSQRSRSCLAVLIAAVCVAFSPPLKAAVVTETFTDYNAFLSLLGPTAQVVNFDDIPNPNGFAPFLSNRYADQGLLFNTPSAAQNPGYGLAVLNFGSAAISPPNVYEKVFGADSPNATGGAFRSQTFLYFTHDGQPALTSAFGTFFIGNEPVNGSDLSGMSTVGDYNFIPAPTTTSPTGSTFLGLATVDSVTGQLVPAIDQIVVNAGQQSNLDVWLDNFTLATPALPGKVPPVPEANAWALFAGTALAAVGLYRRRAPASA